MYNRGYIVWAIVGYIVKAIILGRVGGIVGYINTHKIHINEYLRVPTLIG